MDLFDRAQLETDRFIEYHLNSRPRYTEKPVKPEGFCHFCEEEVEGKQLFCDGMCATLFARRNKR